MAFFSPFAASAQIPGGVGGWYVLSAKKNFNKKWFAIAEAQVRSLKVNRAFSYHEYKFGVGYNFPKNISLVLAGGRYTTYQFDEKEFSTPVQNDEFRIWQQLVLNNNWGRVKLEHRYRFEQRFTSQGYRNRFRYRINLLYPFNKPKIENGAVYLNVSNEFFLHNRNPFFEQNRFYAGLGWVMHPNFTLQSGILNRTDLLGSGKDNNKNFFQLSLLFTIDEIRSGRERHPSSVD
ncbi:MAG: DUF2490 domain-containing protein [Sphingobacteriia bacterium]|nr:MAG: DUF2490 domain-containing protein [Sphingobacteriia bacterium]